MSSMNISCTAKSNGASTYYNNVRIEANKLDKTKYGTDDTYSFFKQFFYNGDDKAVAAPQVRKLMGQVDRIDGTAHTLSLTEKQALLAYADSNGDGIISDDERTDARDNLLDNNGIKKLTEQYQEILKFNKPTIQKNSRYDEHLTINPGKNPDDTQIVGFKGSADQFGLIINKKGEMSFIDADNRLITVNTKQPYHNTSLFEYKKLPGKTETTLFDSSGEARYLVRRHDDGSIEIQKPSGENCIAYDKDGTIREIIQSSSSCATGPATFDKPVRKGENWRSGSQDDSSEKTDASGKSKTSKGTSGSKEDVVGEEPDYDKTEDNPFNNMMMLMLMQQMQGGGGMNPMMLLMMQQMQNGTMDKEMMPMLMMCMMNGSTGGMNPMMMMLMMQQIQNK